MPQVRRRSSRLARAKPYPMTEVDGPAVEEFVQSGRTGRRNALANILDPNVAATSTASLPGELASKLQFAGDDSNEKNKSGQASGSNPGASKEESSYQPSTPSSSSSSDPTSGEDVNCKDKETKGS